jgi:hypothetical protein
MAKEKYIITSDCRFNGENHKKGEIVTLDMEDKEEGKLIALLNHAGRIGEATPANVKAITGK